MDVGSVSIDWSLAYSTVLSNSMQSFNDPIGFSFLHQFFHVDGMLFDVALTAKRPSVASLPEVLYRPLSEPLLHSRYCIHDIKRHVPVVDCNLHQGNDKH
jgi:hypothetical protein